MQILPGKDELKKKMFKDSDTEKRNDLSKLSREFDYTEKVAKSNGKLWCEHYPKHQKIYANLAVHKNKRICDILTPGRRVLDIGCGFGDTLYLLRDAFEELYGIDVSPQMILQSQKNLKLRGLDDKAAVMHCSGGELVFPNEYFDAVILADVYEHIRVKDREKTLREVNRVLKRCGELVIVTPSIWHIRFLSIIDNFFMIPLNMKRGQKISLFSLPKKNYTEIFCTKKEVVKDIENTGFQLKRFERVGFYPAPERPGFLGIVLEHILPDNNSWGYVSLMKLFQKIEKTGIFNQKMLFQCSKSK